MGLPKGTPFGYPKGTPCGLLKGASGKDLGDWKIINLSESDSCYAKLLLLGFGRELPSGLQCLGGLVKQSFFSFPFKMSLGEQFFFIFPVEGAWQNTSFFFIFILDGAW